MGSGCEEGADNKVAGFFDFFGSHHSDEDARDHDGASEYFEPGEAFAEHQETNERDGRGVDAVGEGLETGAEAVEGCRKHGVCNGDAENGADDETQPSRGVVGGEERSPDDQQDCEETEYGDEALKKRQGERANGESADAHQNDGKGPEESGRDRAYVSEGKHRGRR